MRNLVKKLATWLAGLVGLVVSEPVQQVDPGMDEDAVKTLVAESIRDYTTALFTALKTAGVDVDTMVGRFSAFQAEVNTTVAEREAAVDAAEAALALAEDLVERAYDAQDKLFAAATAMPAPGSIPAIEI